MANGTNNPTDNSFARAGAMDNINETKNTEKSFEERSREISIIARATDLVKGELNKLVKLGIINYQESVNAYHRVNAVDTGRFQDYIRNKLSSRYVSDQKLIETVCQFFCSYVIQLRQQNQTCVQHSIAQNANIPIPHQQSMQQ